MIELDVRPRYLPNGRRLLLALAGIPVIGARGGGPDSAVADVTSPIAPYVENETLDAISKEEAATALGAGELSHADRDRIFHTVRWCALRWTGATPGAHGCDTGSTGMLPVHHRAEHPSNTAALGAEIRRGR